jgi:hypothetical protein
VQNIKKSFLQRGALLLVGVLFLQGCKPDTAPDPFTFASQTKVTPDTLIESEPVTISGINLPAQLSITGGEYSIDDRPFKAGPGAILNDQKVRIRVRSSSESSGVVSATLTIGGVSGTFTVRTANSTGRVEAEAASALGGASTVADAAASKGKAVFVGSAGLGISTDDSVDAKALILAYRADTAGTLEVKVNGTSAGKFTLRPTAGAYATASVVVAVHTGDVIAIASPAAAASSETYLDYVQFTDSPFKAVSTVGNVADPWASDGVAVAANGFNFDSKGNLFVADWQGNALRKVTPDGVMTTIASGLNGPGGAWVDKDDNVLVSLYGTGSGAGSGATVLKITPDGTVSTYASGAPLQDVVTILTDENNNVYAGNWASGTIFNITNGNVSQLAVVGGATNQVCYSRGYIYVASPTISQVRRVSLDGTVDTFSGTDARQIIDGPLATADFFRPNSCTISKDGTIMYVMEREHGILRRIDAGAP